MARSLGLMAAVIVVLLLFVPGLLHPSKSQRFPGVTYGDDVTGFHQVTGLDAAVPSSGSLSGWKATSATLTGDRTDERLRIGWATPGQHYAELDDVVGSSTAVVTSVLGAKASTVTGTVTVDGVAWQRRTSQRGETALTHSDGRVTEMVTGSATVQQLQQLAASLR